MLWCSANLYKRLRERHKHMPAALLNASFYALDTVSTQTITKPKVVLGLSIISTSRISCYFGPDMYIKLREHRLWIIRALFSLIMGWRK